MAQSRILPVTAVAVVDKFVLAAAGWCLEVLPLSASVEQSPFSQQIFASQTIHGINVCRCGGDQDVAWLILVWGGRHFRVLSAQVVSEIQLEFSAMSESKNFDDWILDLRVTPFTCDGLTSSPKRSAGSTIDECRDETSTYLAVALTVHNALVTVKISVTSTHRIFLDLRSTTTPANTMMFSGKVSFASADLVLVAAGSTFGEVSLWSCRLAHTITATEVSVLDKELFFPAHDGSVYGLDLLIDPGKFALLVTCSDDRTIRVWDVASYLEGHDIMSGPHTSMIESRVPDLATTWGRNSGATVDGSLPLLTTAWAHDSRIWNIHFISKPHRYGTEDNKSKDTQKDSKDLELKLCTCGEDATIQFWKLRSGERMAPASTNLVHVRTVSAHSGKNVWNVTVEPNEDLIVSGGADGDVCSIPSLLPHLPIQNTGFVDNVWSLKDNSIQFNDFESTGVGSSLTSDVFRSFSFLGDGAFLAATRKGHVFMAETGTKSALPRQVSSLSRFSWKFLGHREDLISHAVVVTLPSFGSFADSIGFFAGATGKIFCFSHGQLHLEPFIDVASKVPAMFVQLHPRGNKAYWIALLVSILGSSHATFVLFDCRPSTMTEPVSDFVKSYRHIDLVLPHNFVVTSMLYCTQKDYDHLFLGSRDGRIMRLSEIQTQMSIHKEKNFKETLKLQRTIILPHKDAVTALLIYDQESSNPESFASVSRDSTVAVHTLNLEQLHQLESPFGNNIEGAFLDKEDHKIYQYGFQGERFAIQDTTTHRNIMHIECGGANRIWSFHHAQDLNKRKARTSLLWTRKGSLNLRTERAPNHLTLRWGGGHGREIKACATTLVCSSTRSLYKQWLVATGAEDTDIRIFKAIISKIAGSRNLPTIQCQMVIHKHNTGIQHLQWSRNSQRLFSSAGSEEFYIWRIRQNIDFVDIGVICESALPRYGNRFDLRITHFDIREQDDESVYRITMCLSDSTWRVYEYHAGSATREWTQLATGLYANNCLTTLTYLQPPLAANFSNPEILCTASSNGHLTLSSTISSESPILGAKCIHQSSVSSLVAMPIPSSQSSHKKSHILISASDDNSIAASLVDLEFIPDAREPPMVASSLLKSADVDQASGKSSESLAPQITESHGRPCWRLKSWSVLRVPQAHAASVTALAVVHQSSSLNEKSWTASHSNDCCAVVSDAAADEGRVLTIVFVTSGPDQRLKRWHLTVDTAGEGTDSLQLRRTGNFPTSVADLGAICMLKGATENAFENEEEQAKKMDGGDDADMEEETKQRQIVVVCGVGMEVRDIA